MKRIIYDRARFGRDLIINIDVHTPTGRAPGVGPEIDLAGRDLRLVVINPSGDACALGFSMEGNKIKAYYEGRQHRCEGLHHLVLTENLGAVGQDVIRWESFVYLTKIMPFKTEVNLKGEFAYKIEEGLEYLMLGDVYAVLF